MGGSSKPVRMAAVAAALVGGAELERRHLRRIASDPQRSFLQSPPTGTPLSARSADGTNIHAEVFGPDGLPTLVLAHGWTEALRYWALVIRELSREFRIVAYDLRGHGRSARAAGNDYALQRFGEDLETVLSAAVPEGERALLAGHSLGGMSIAAWAAHHDIGRARAAALLFTGLGNLAAEQLIIFAARAVHGLRDPIARRAFGVRLPLPRFTSPVTHAALRHIAFGPGASPAVVAFWERMLVSCAPHARAAVGMALADMDLHHTLERLTLPTLVMAGALDRMTPPSHARRIAAQLPQLAGLVELPDTGHMGPLETPGRDRGRAPGAGPGDRAPTNGIARRSKGDRRGSVVNSVVLYIPEAIAICGGVPGAWELCTSTRI